MGSRLEKNSKVVRKLIENHVFDDEDGEEYGASKFGGVGDLLGSGPVGGWSHGIQRGWITGWG